MSFETDVVDARLEAYQARDVERFLSHYADDVSVVMFRRHREVRQQAAHARAVPQDVR
jgi:hypothetical protein